MSELNIQELLQNMVDAAKGTLDDEAWDKAGKFVKKESEKFLQDIAEIHKWKMEGSITEEQSDALLRLHKRSMKMVLTASAGISLIMAEKAINAALDVIRQTVNGIIGWDLL